MPSCPGSKGKAITKNQTRRIARWLILIFACWINFGNYYVYDNPSALNRQLETWLDISEEEYGFQFMLFYSIYSIPNIFLPFLIGGLLDIYGTNTLLLILAGLVCLGQGIFAIGGQFKILPIMLLGRIVFGFGGESLTVAQARLITDWFSGSELCFAIGITLAMSRAGLVLNNVLSPIIYDLASLPTALWAGFAFCVLSYVLTFISVLLNKRLSYVRVAPVCNDPDCCSLLARPSIMTPQSLNIRELLASTPAIVKTFHPAFFVLCGACFALNGSIIPFNNIASDFLQRKWYSTSPSMASWTMSIPDTMAIFLIPVIGYVIDLYGYKVAYLIGSGFALGLGHFLMARDISSPVIPLIINGLASSAVVAIWPCIPSLVPELYRATAYGIVTVCINVSYIFVPICVATLANMDRFYGSVELFLSLQSILGAFLSILFDSARKLPAPSTLFSPTIAGATASTAVSTQAFAILEKMPRAPTFSGPPESFLVSLDDGHNNNDGETDDSSEGEQWWGDNSYDETICSFVTEGGGHLWSIAAATSSSSPTVMMFSSVPAPFHRHQFINDDEPISLHVPKPFKHTHSIIRFGDDSQIEERVCLSNILRRRGNSVVGI